MNATTLDRLVKILENDICRLELDKGQMELDAVIPPVLRDEIARGYTQKIREYQQLSTDLKVERSRRLS